MTLWLQEQLAAGSLYTWLQTVLGNPISTLILTLLGVFGSIFTLAASDTSVPSHAVKGLLIAGALPAILCGRPLF